MTKLSALRAQLESAVAGCPKADLPELTGLLEAAKVRAMARALSPAPPTTDVVAVATLAAELDLAESWLRAQARAGKLPHLRAGKYIKFRRSEVLAVLADHRMRTPAGAEKPNENVGPLPGRYRANAAAEGHEGDGQ